MGEIIEQCRGAKTLEVRKIETSGLFSVSTPIMLTNGDHVEAYVGPNTYTLTDTGCLVAELRMNQIDPGDWLENISTWGDARGYSIRRGAVTKPLDEGRGDYPTKVIQFAQFIAECQRIIEREERQ